MQDTLGLKGQFRVIKTCAKTGELISVSDWYDNIIVDGTDTGFNLIIDRLNGTNTYSLNITHLGIGDDNTAPTNADTALGNEIARGAKVTGTVSGSTVTFRFFFADGDLANDDYYEVGLFVDGTATLNSGKLFSHALFGSVYTKGTGQDTTIEYAIKKMT